MKKIFIVLIACAFVMTPGHINAQNFSEQGLEVSPFLIDIEVPKGGEQPSSISLTNKTNSPLQITVTPRDFLPGMEGQPEFVQDIEINDPTFSLASWIQLENDSKFVIEQKQTVTVPFIIQPPENAEDGTHYGALLFSYEASNALTDSKEIQQTVGTIILVKYGVGREAGAVTMTANRKLQFSSDKVSIYNLFQNDGNIHVQPKGDVVVKNVLGQTVASVAVNRDASNVLPNTQRSYASSWIPSSLSFGRYTLESTLIYGRGKLEAKDSVVIWILPFYSLIIIALVLIFISWLLFHGRHIYKRKVIEKHLKKAAK